MSDLRDASVAEADPAPPGEEAASTRRDVPRHVAGEESALPAVARNRAIGQFFGTRTVPGDCPLETGLGGRVPALLHSYLSERHLRGPFPLVAHEAGGVLVLDPLSSLVDQWIDAVCDASDEGEIRKRLLWRLERRLSPAVSTAFPQQWNQALKEARGELSPERSAALDAVVSDLGDRVPAGGMLYPCEAKTPAEILFALAEHARKTQGADLTEEAERLSVALRALLTVDHDEEERDPARLRRASGGAYADAFDFEALSSILEEAPHGTHLPEDRRQRIESTVDELDGLLETIYSDVNLEPLAPTMAEAAMTRRLDALVSLFRAIQVARLEAENRFEPGEHAAYLDALSTELLSEEDLLRCPPVLVAVDEDSLSGADETAVLRMLASRWPYKIVLTLRRAAEEPAAGAAAAALPRAALGYGDAYVVQTPLSRGDVLSESLREGLSTPGPALFAIYAGPSEGSALGSPYLRAAVAADSRAVPLFRYLPKAGTTWAERFDVGANDAPELDWPEGTLTFEELDGGLSQEHAAFTWLEFAATIDSFSRDFLPIPGTWEDDVQVPADHFLALSEADRDGRVPYVWTTDPTGNLERCIVSRYLMERALDARHHWRRTRELGGIENSHVLRALAEARKAWDAELEQALEQAKGEHAAAMDQAVATVAGEVVANIAAGLLGVAAPAGSVAAPAISVQRAAAQEATPATETEAPAPPEEPVAPEPEPLILDEAYIETPRCTSCNECTGLNAQIFAYNDEKQAFIKDASAGPFRDIVMAAEKCPVRIIHPGKPSDASEPGLDEWLERAKPFL